MVRMADHERRRTEIAAAAVDIARQEGLGRVTIAAVAARSGVSVGLVQHYFPGKDLLVHRAYAELLASMERRVAAIVDVGERREESIRTMCTTALTSFLPVPENRRDCLARAEFQVLAARTEALAAVAREDDRALRGRLRGVVANARLCGEVAPEADEVAVADELWAAVLGAAAVMLVDPTYPGEAVLAEATRRAFPRPCRRHEETPAD